MRLPPIVFDTNAAAPERTRQLLASMGYRFRGKYRRSESHFVFQRRRKAILMYSCFWHWHIHAECPQCGATIGGSRSLLQSRLTVRQRDSRRLAAIRRQGWKTLVVWECQTRQPAVLLQRIRLFLDS
jgi:DNA mismatch endonuclease (patch repair protein)